jgi:arginyl-tRNA--protein-N-Asp/Glu arginylyltransferase
MRRHTFTEWELELLLDLQRCRIRKSARADLLRRYLRTVHRDFAAGALSPLRFASFLERRNQRHHSNGCNALPRVRAVHSC